MTTDPSPGRVLVVDDEEAMVALLKGWIETLGFAVDSVSDGAEALEAARLLLPDVIVMDTMIPVRGGFETLLALKQDPIVRDIPVLFLTVRNEVQDVVNALDIGATDYMTKPFKPQELLARLRSVVRMKQQQDRLRELADTAEMQRDRLQAWIENLPGAFLALDGSGAAAGWNRRAREATGLEPARVLGLQVEEILRLEGACPWQDRVPFDGPATVLAASGPLAIRAMGQPLPEEAGGGYGVLLFFP